MRLVVISHTDCFEGEAAILNELFAAGLDHLHLRKPLAQKSEVRRLLGEIDPAYRAYTALHQFHELAAGHGITRLHFTEHHRVAADKQTLTSLAEQGCILTTSVHNMCAAQQLPSLFSYTFFGPVFNSISKEDYHAIVGEDFFWPNEHKAVPVIALGGIDVPNIGRVAAMNFDGAAVLGAIWKKPAQAVEEFKAIKQLCERLPV